MKFEQSKYVLVRVKLIILLLTGFCIQLSSANVFGQRVTLEARHATLEQVLRKIERQSGYTFFYNRKEMTDIGPITLSVKDEGVTQTLDKLFKNKPYGYEIQEKIIVLNKKDVKPIRISVPVAATKAVDEQQLVSGRVTDSLGNPIEGVSILVQGTSRGTATDAQGRYQIQADPGDVLVVRLVGFQEQEVIVKGTASVDVTLKILKNDLDEVIVVGYGTGRKKDLTGSITTVNVEDSPIAMAPNINALQSLKGTAPGINIGTVNSAGGNPDLMIRGQNSINGSNYPLIVLDGSIFLGSINDINPADISSFNILKDASSTAIYGSRAANGVVIINTKQGKNPKPVITYNFSGGMYAWFNKPDLMDGPQWINKVNAFLSSDDPMFWLEQMVKDNYQNGKTTNWIDLGVRNGSLLNHQLAVSGNAENINYYLSGGYVDQKGVIKGDDYKRISLKGRMNTNITKWLQVDADAIYNFSDYSGIGANLGGLIPNSPYGVPYRDEQNKLLERYVVGTPSFQNGLWGTDGTISDIEEENFYRLALSAQIDVPFIKGLSYRMNYVNLSKQYIDEKFYHENYYVVAEQVTGPDIDRYGPDQQQKLLNLANGNIRHENISNYVWDNIINYKRQFSTHYLDITLVATRDFQTNKAINSLGSDFTTNGNTLLGTGGLSKANNQFINQNQTEVANIGYMARLNYTYLNRYHFTSSIRRDGSSVFGVDNKWGNFPSVGAAWTVSEERFLKGNTHVNYLKLKASFGKNGNQGISPYETLAAMVSGREGGLIYEFADQPGTAYYGTIIGTLGNTFLGWETTTSLNVGVESGFFNNRITLDLDYYTSKTTDQLFTRQIPVMTGFSTIRSSMGRVDNKGIELGLKTTNLERIDFSWTSGLTFWRNRNKLVELYGDGKDDISNNLFIGKSLGAIYGYESIGIVQEEDTDYITNTDASPGDVKFRDIDGNGDINLEDRKILGYSKENFRLNLSNNLSYKQLGLYVMVSGIFGGGAGNFYVQSNPQAYLTASTRHGDNRLDIPWWTPENRSNVYPSIHYSDNRFLGLESRTFVRLQDIILSYRFKQDWLSRHKLLDLKLYSGIQNLLTFTSWSGGGDPEAGIPALSSTYPVPATFTLGLDIRF